VRRLLIILLVLVLPLKAFASVDLSLAGGKHAGESGLHDHVDHAVQAHGDGTAAGNASCCDFGHADSSGHECPHLAMPLLAASPAIAASDRDPDARPLARARAFASVVLDVLHPPPLRRQPALRG